MGYYFYSDSRQKRANAIVKLRDAVRKHEAAEKVISKYKRARGWHYCKEIGAYAGVFLVTGAFMFWLYLGQEAYELSLLKGRLYPANDPMPDHSCGTMKDNSIVIFLGSNIFVVDKFPHAVLAVTGEERLIINRANDGSIAVTLVIFGEDRRVVAKIEDGNFVVNYNNSLDMRRKDRNSLEVIDQFNKRVLNMRYLNRQAMLIDAVLYYPGVKDPIVIDGSKSISPRKGYNIHSNCMHDSRLADIIF